MDKITSKSISILQLQSFKNKNCVKEHEKLVSEIKKQYGSFRKASVALKVPWKTFYRLCQKPKKRQKMVRDQWVEIRKFYSRDKISTELPNIKTAGRHYLTKTLEQSYQFYKEECINAGNKSMSFATFCRFRPQMFTQSTRHRIGSASVTHVKISSCLGKHLDTITSRALQVIQMSV